MRFLIDTECWLWWFLEPERLNSKSADLIADRTQSIYLSAASSWEIAIKCRLGKLVLPEAAASYVPRACMRKACCHCPLNRRTLFTSIPSPIIIAIPSIAC